MKTKFNFKITNMVKRVSTSALVVVLSLASCSNKQVYFNTITVNDQTTVEVKVMATGTIQPVEVVDVGTQVSGVIEKIYADYNSHVEKGQLLAELDKLTLQEKLNQANASQTRAESELNYARQNHDRIKQLYETKAATQVSYEEAVNRLVQAETSLDDAKANVHQAKVNLSYAYVYSPIDGVVLDRSVNVGQTVAAAFSTPTLFKIAEDLTKMQVEADVDEADIGMVKVGQPVSFTVDAYNNDLFKGTVSQIRLQPKTTNNVVTYTVIVEAPNPGEKLFPGMTANIYVEVDKEQGISVPVEALRFASDPETTQKYGITPAQNKSGSQVIVQKDGITSFRNIELGIDDGIHAIVRSGLATGEEVALSASTEKKKDAVQSNGNSVLARNNK
ncbi:MAG: efflux RND transporter periplasmic adaptor subunit [Bacteroidales bacterium]|jgi:HlyD family secretion protein|nr:efflux RND transporter periplasmic adaptor subunit [Bacteroidales bacterium]